MEAEVFRIIDRTFFWEQILKEKNLRRQVKKILRETLKKDEAILEGTAFLSVEMEMTIDEAVRTIENGSELAYGRFMPLNEARALGSKYAWTGAEEAKVAIVKCDEEGELVENTGAITMKVIHDLLEKEVWNRQQPLRERVVESLETVRNLLGWFIRLLTVALKSIS